MGYGKGFYCYFYPQGDYIMELLKGTKAHQAHEAGKNAFAQGKQLKDNQYTTSRVIALSNWWVKGFNSLKF